MHSSDVFQSIGAVLGLSGAVLTSMKSERSRRWGFAAWVASNAFLLTWYCGLSAWWMVGLSVCYTATSLNGWRNNR